MKTTRNKKSAEFRRKFYAPLLFDLGDFIIFFFVCQIKRRNRGKIFLFRTDNLPAGAPRHLNFFQECAILKENYAPVVVPRLAAALSPRDALVARLQSASPSLALPVDFYGIKGCPILTFYYLKLTLGQGPEPARTPRIFYQRQENRAKTTCRKGTFS